MNVTQGEAPGARVRVTGVTKHYKEVVALDDLSIDIEAGEFITLLGASGSGKSTLLSIIAGFMTPTTGSVEVGGEDLTRVPPYRRGLGMVFQNYALFPHMSVFDNVAFPLRRRKVAKSQVAERVQKALDTVELGHLASRMPQQLSGGQQQRVALARAIVFEPRVLLLDEPLGALDKRLRDQLQFELKRLHKELGITFVFVTHDQEEALAMSDRIALMRDGRIIQIDAPRDLYEKPVERYAAEFLGESNILEGVIHEGSFDRLGVSLRLARSAAASVNGSALLIRPEHLGLYAAGTEVPAEHNALPGTVRELVYLGSTRRVEVVLDDGQHVVARTPIDPRGGGPIPGDPVMVAWDRDCGVLLADPAGPRATEEAVA
ncbi:ABC transporter ATP-binding protein [Aeromicrobium sp. P5_D10]